MNDDTSLRRFNVLEIDPDEGLREIAKQFNYFTLHSLITHGAYAENSW